MQRGGQVLHATEFTDVPAAQATDVGRLTLGALGQFELVIGGVPASDLAKLSPVLNRDGHGTQELTLRDGRFVSREILPGKWTLSAGRTRWFFRHRDVDIPEADTLAVRVTAEQALELRVMCMFGAEGWRTLHYEVRDHDGVLVFRSGTMIQAGARDGAIELHGLALPLGDYVLSAWTDSGLRATEALAVDDPMQARLLRTIVLR